MGDLVKVYLCCDRDAMIEDLGERNFTRGLTRWMRCEDYDTLTARLAAAEAELSAWKTECLQVRQRRIGFRLWRWWMWWRYGVSIPLVKGGRDE